MVVRLKQTHLGQFFWNKDLSIHWIYPNLPPDAGKAGRQIKVQVGIHVIPVGLHSPAFGVDRVDSTQP